MKLHHCLTLRTLLLVGCAYLLSACGAATTTTSETPGAPERSGKDVFESADFFVVMAKAGDTAQSLAAKYLGDPAKDWMIEDYNNATTFTPGQQVVIPKRYWNVSGVTGSGYQLVPILVYHNLA